ncbi:hypothetical protein ACFL25_00880 [Patescibacteria group bacterium]
MEKENFKLKVVSREGMLFEGEVNSITSNNEKGVFDVLAQHANFISLIKKGLLIRDVENNEREIIFDNALLKVYRNNVEVYVGVDGMASAEMERLGRAKESRSNIAM